MNAHGTLNTFVSIIFLLFSLPNCLWLVLSRIQQKKNTEQLRKIADTRGKLHREKSPKQKTKKKNNNRLALFFNSFSNDFCMWLTSFRENYVEKMIFLVVFYPHHVIRRVPFRSHSVSHTLGFVSAIFSENNSGPTFVCRYSSDKFDSVCNSFFCFSCSPFVLAKKYEFIMGTVRKVNDELCVFKLFRKLLKPRKHEMQILEWKPPMKT